MASPSKSGPASPTSPSPASNGAAAASSGAGGGLGAKPSYSGDFWNLFFNGKSAIAEAFRRDPKLEGATPAWILGRRFDDADPDEITQRVNQSVKHIHYFSYRNRLVDPLEGGLDHDAGWGCMIRTGQMMLCEALRRCLPEAAARHAQHLFWDVKTAPFGLHRMTEAGKKAHIAVGNWFSPTALAHTVKRLVASSEITNPHIGVVIGQDGSVNREDIVNEFVEHGRPALVLVPIMAGRERIPADAQKAVLKMFELPCTLGIVGGRPKHSLYFVGAQRENVFYLDPHTVQPAFTSPETVGNASGVRGTLHVSDVDPSMVLCFLLAKKRDLEEWERAFRDVINPLTEYPLFSILAPRNKARTAAGAGGASPAALRAPAPTSSASPGANASGSPSQGLCAPSPANVSVNGTPVGAQPAKATPTAAAGSSADKGPLSPHASAATPSDPTALRGPSSVLSDDSVAARARQRADEDVDMCDYDDAIEDEMAQSGKQ